MILEQNTKNANTAYPSYVTLTANSLFLEVKIQTKASRERFLGEYAKTLKIALTSAPTDGKANQQLITFLAKVTKLPKQAITITRGTTSHHKQLTIQTANPQATWQLLQQAIYFV